MPTVSRLLPDRRTPGGVVVELDGARFATLPVEVARGLGLRAGHRLDQAGVTRLRDAAEMEAAHRVATRLLAVRAHSEFELGRKLRERGHAAEVIRPALGRLRRAGVLDDLAFSRQFAASRLARGHGPARILADLSFRGVDRRTAERAVDEVGRDEGVQAGDMVRRLIERRAPSVRGLPAQVQLRRLLAFLARRGFHGRQVRRLVEGALVH